MKLIITRPIEDGEKLAASLEASGHHCTLLPLINIVSLEHTIPDKTYSGICITSANGLRHAKWRAQHKQTKVFAVGPQSEAEARRLGFENVTALGGDVDGLVAGITAHREIITGPLLYPSGTETSGDLEGKLNASGFEVDRIRVYDAVPLENFAADFHTKDYDSVLLYSARTASIWKKLTGDTAAHITHLCLSENVARKLPANWPKNVAKSPTDQGMRDLLESFAKAE